MPKLIKTWDELKECTSETHTLEIEDCCGWIHAKNVKDDDNGGYGHYLSTHTFYGGTHEYSTKLLQSCGFDVEIANWDEEEEGRVVEIVGNPGTGHRPSAGVRKAMIAMATMEGVMAGMGIPSYSEYLMDSIPKGHYERRSSFPPRKTAQGRNERCACGSGKKYKVCCGQ